MAQKGKKGTYLDGRTYAEVCKPGGKNNVNYSDDKIIIKDFCCEDDGRGNVSVAEPGIFLEWGTRISPKKTLPKFRRYYHHNFYVDIYSNIDLKVSDMDGSRNRELSSSDNIVSEVCIDSRSYVDLPFEIIYDIFLRLPIEDIARCKTVCQTWYNLTREPDFTSLQANRSPLCQPQRILLVPVPRKRNQPIDSLFLLDINQKCTKIPLKNLELPRHYRVANCCNGLVCIASIFSPDEPVFICNPITGECNQLPKQDRKHFKTRGPLYGFGFDRFSNKYKVVCVYRPYCCNVDNCDRNLSVDPVTMGEIMTEGEDSWRKLEIPYQVRFCHRSETVFLDDAFHWMTRTASDSKLILALDVNSEKFHTLQLSPEVLPAPGYYLSFINSAPGYYLSLINFAGSLAFVEFDDMYDCPSKIWKIVSSETNDTWICEYTCKYVSKIAGLGNTCTALGSIDGSILYQATKYELGVYIPEKKESFLLNMQGYPDSFQTVLFTPTLISPKTLHFPWPWSPSIIVMSRKEKPSKRRSGRR